MKILGLCGIGYRAGEEQTKHKRPDAREAAANYNDFRVNVVAGTTVQFNLLILTLYWCWSRPSENSLPLG